MARHQLPEETVVPWLQWQRWGVCDAGTAALCAVALKPVHRFQRRAAQRAAVHHRQSVQHVDGEGVQWDAAHSERRPTQMAWVHTAWARGRWLLLWVACGPRTQGTATVLIAQVV